MTGFSAEWLALREPIDAAARAPAIAKRLSQLMQPGLAHCCFDLGCGTGANVRYLASLLRGVRRWVLVDSDARHLERARELAAAGIRSVPAGHAARGDGGVHAEGAWHGAHAARGMISAPAAGAFETRCIDLARHLENLDLEEGALVSASALLDLVSAAWLTGLLERCRASKAVVLFALSYDGRIELEPGDPDDAIVRDLVNRHQRTDKGFGPALGPAAVSFARDRLEDLNYRTQSATSDWLLSPLHASLQESLLRGWARAAIQIAPSQQHTCEGWLTRRLAYLEQGRSSMRVGHQDLIAWPHA